MELKQIKELMTAMERAGIKKLSIKEKSGFELQLERQEDSSHLPPAPLPSSYHPSFYPSSAPTREAEHPGRSHMQPVLSHPASKMEEGGHEKKEEKGKFVTSPMVGTFYVAASPDDPSFVKVGDRVDENTVVCIIEAMKVMNEVKAGVAGVIAEIYIENAHPVEFGTKIFRIV
ncbi:MAG: acetyl-CoA carboxylase biotin carboxyl carrier protein [Anaerolineae bacterium]